MNILEGLLDGVCLFFEAVYDNNSELTIAQSISTVRCLAREKLQDEVLVEEWLNKPLIDNLSPWQLVINKRTSEVINFLKIV